MQQIDPYAPLQQLARRRAARLPPCVWLLAAALACGTTEGPLLRAAGAGPTSTPNQVAVSLDAGLNPAVDSELNPAPDAGQARVAPSMRLHYQITGSPELDAEADVFVLDLFDAPAAQLATLHTRGRIVIAYLSAGSLEAWRPDADDIPARAIGSQLAAYPDERWLDIRDSSVRTIMRARLMLARSKGFDGVYPGALHAYRSQSGFALSERDQLDYDQFLSTEARGLGLTPVLSGDFMLGAQLIDQFDWAIAIGCIAADSCEALRPWIEQRRPVFDLELEGELSHVCERAQELGLTAVLKHPSFDAWSRSCP